MSCGRLRTSFRFFAIALPALAALLVAIAGCSSSPPARETHDAVALPEWFFTLPYDEGVYYAIGESPQYKRSNREHEIAREFAAYRLACSIECRVRFGAAEELSSRELRSAAFTWAEPDSEVVETVRMWMTVLDSINFDGQFFLLAAYSRSAASPPVPTGWRNSLYYSSLPSWVSNPPREDLVIYGVGIEEKTGTLGWEAVEQHARAEIAKQFASSNLGLLVSGSSEAEYLHDEHHEITLRNSRIIRRAMDTQGRKYALARMSLR